MENNKDKRISFLSIFSSITHNLNKQENFTNGMWESMQDAAFDINNRLYQKYPLEEEKVVVTEETKEVCKKCKSKKVIRSGEKNGNKWKGMFCSNPECDEKPKWLPTSTPEEAEKQVKENYSSIEEAYGN